MPLVAQMPALEEFKLGSAQVTDDGLQLLAASKSLKKLSLSGLKGITPAGIEKLRKAQPQWVIEVQLMAGNAKPLSAGTPTSSRIGNHHGQLPLATLASEPSTRSPWTRCLARVCRCSTACGRCSAPDKAAQPKRSVFIYLPNGVNTIAYEMTTAGPDYKLSKPLAALEKHREVITPISGLHHPHGLGHHHNCSTIWLTGGKIGPSERNTISVDQLMAQVTAPRTRYLVDRNEQPGPFALLQRRWHRAARPGKPRRRVSRHVHGTARRHRQTAAWLAASSQHSRCSSRPSQFAGQSARQGRPRPTGTVSDLRSRSRRFAPSAPTNGSIRRRPKVDPALHGATESRYLPGTPRRVSPHDVRHHRAGVPDRHDPRGHLQHRQRRRAAQPCPRSASSRIAIRCRTTTAIRS